jgi:hypothetical protein
MEYPELIPIVLVMVVVGTVLGSSRRIQAVIRRGELLFRSPAPAVLAVAVVLLAFVPLMLPGVASKPWWLLYVAAAFFGAPTLAWLVWRGSQSAALRALGAVGFLYPLAFFAAVIRART